jgi:hypothetical protein
MAMRKLKLPDGGAMQLELPNGFGDAGLGATTSAGDMTAYLVGAAFGAVAGFLIVYAATKIARAVEQY